MDILDSGITLSISLVGLLILFSIVLLFVSIIRYFNSKTYLIDLENFITEKSYKDRFPVEFEEYFVATKKRSRKNEK